MRAATTKRQSGRLSLRLNCKTGRDDVETVKASGGIAFKTQAEFDEQLVRLTEATRKEVYRWMGWS